ncbi:MAG TPA: chemotaxis protein CheA [Anaerohalosphaeraceae bacterium]|nr:chemotaxis protein CheA [Anaerohalosphaeraceae bacterium]HOL89658.1 chemotaxis protein CheA [Anaerohalosphaeraceae bacterium]HPP56600.1 chemotaxis protein CheA [Anaerohalosphaeraceae bacterium]
MEKTGKITELIEQAAGKIPLLDPQDTRDIEEIAGVFKQIEEAVKTLSGCEESSRLQAQSLAHLGAEQIEKLLRQELQSSEQVLQELTKAVSQLQTLTQSLSSASGAAPAPTPPAAPAETSDFPPTVIAPDDAPLVQDFLNESREHLESAETALLSLENDPTNTETLNQIFRGFHTIKGMAGFLNLTAINRLAHVSENLLDRARKGTLTMSGAASNLAFGSIDMLKTMLKDLEAGLAQNTPIPAPKDLPSLIQKIQDCAEGRLQPEPAPVTSDVQQDLQLEPILQPESQAKTAVSSVAAPSAARETIKVSTKRLDDLINMTGELAVAQLMISEEVSKTCHTDSDLYRKVASQSKIVRDLQELSMSMRMIPMQGAFQKMARLVRDLSQKAGKPINFQTSGEETELDRTIVDKITDPLIHMVRNSIDHGIEPPEERVKKGKSPQGLLRLSAYHQAGSIVIEIEDDGRGLNAEKIRKKALEKGLISEHQELTEEELLNLIFKPGFSTADKVTEISGRGVGMDVVKKNIDALNGKIEMKTAPDKGTLFMLRLPLTLAIIDGQIVTIGSQRYIIPINSVIQSLRPTPDQISTIRNRSKVVMIRGQLHPLIPLYKLFRISGAVEEPEQALLVVVGEGSRRCCLQVDDLLGQQQVVIKSLRGLGKIKGVSGGAIMGDGQISLILDVPGLLELAQGPDANL